MPYFGVVSIEWRQKQGSCDSDEMAILNEEVSFDGNGLDLSLDTLGISRAMDGQRYGISIDRRVSRMSPRLRQCCGC